MIPTKLPFLTIFFITLWAFCKNRLNTATLASNETAIRSRRVPGCPDFEPFQTSSSVDSLNLKQLPRIACLCGPGDPADGDESQGNGADNDTTVSITCIYGSTAADLQNSVALTTKVNKHVERIMLDHMDFSDTNIDHIFGPEMFHLKYLEIKKCRGSLSVNIVENSTTNFDFLQQIDIEECELEEMPTEFLKRSPNLKRLSLVNNKISGLKKSDFSGIKILETLNLAGNLLSSNIEKESISQLSKLKSLGIGEHNYASKTLLCEIGQLENLEILDISQMDGIESTEQFGCFRNMSRLKRVAMSGCNLKVLNSSSFAQFPALEWLDLRVNLIERLENNCFEGLNNLQFLSLAGNFIRHLRELPEQIWHDLAKLESLDIGWNDFRKLNKSSFMGMSKRLERINLRNNEALKEIESGAFDGIEQLRYLNLSGTLLEEIPARTFDLHNLEELDLASCNISSMEQNAIVSKYSIKLLNLAKNELRTLHEGFLDGMNALEMLDISQNKWICDEKVQKISKQLDMLYKNAAIEKRQFELANSENTVCDRPFSRRGDSIFELLGANSSELNYDESMDTTTTVLATTVAPENESVFENSTIDWKAITLLLGNKGDEHPNFTGFEIEEDPRKPKYDINVVKYGQKSVIVKETNSWLLGVVVTLLIVATAFCVIIVARRKNDDDKTEQQTKRDGEHAEADGEHQNSLSATRDDKNYAVSSL